MHLYIDPSSEENDLEQSTRSANEGALIASNLVRNEQNEVAAIVMWKVNEVEVRYPIDRLIITLALQLAQPSEHGHCCSTRARRNRLPD
mmetsp:Transcript_4705/g.8962  ORF Transcript_4705/g.8962 Transcript_4705/m.8962 type:complete len:89 (+) Transcript_4705:462-728(+)